MWGDVEQSPGMSEGASHWTLGRRAPNREKVRAKALGPPRRTEWMI